jgi:hypothetical protein
LCFPHAVDQLESQDQSAKHLSEYPEFHTFQQKSVKMFTNVVTLIQVNGSGVSHSEKFSSVINVTESSVVAIIRGGFNRYVKENSTFFLDATPSFDPDDLNATLL